MKIIDAHFHLFPDSPYMQERLREVGHDGGEAELLGCWEQLDIVHSVMMSNGPLDVERHRHDTRVSYCIGLDSGCLAEYPDPAEAMALVEENLKQPRCVGIKLYPGYNYQYISDAMYTPCYELARKYGKPVAVHMGQTAGPRAKLKYSPPPDAGRGGRRLAGRAVCHVPLRQPLSGGRGGGAGEEPQRVRRPVRPAGGRDGSGTVF